MAQDIFDTQMRSFIEDVNKEEVREQRIKAAAIIGGSAVAGAVVATVAEEYDKTHKVEIKAEEIAETRIKENEEKQEEVTNPVAENKEPQVIEHHYETRTIVREVVHEPATQQQTTIEEPAPVSVTQTSNEQPQPEGTDTKVEVISVHHDVNINGYNMDVAIVDINEDRTMFIDVNQDGMSDALVADVNRNGTIDNGEVFDIRQHHIPMPNQPDSCYPTSNEATEVPEEMPDYSSDDDITLYDI